MMKIISNGNNSRYLAYLLVLILMSFSIFFEQMPLKNMLEFDGGGYLIRAKFFGEMIINREINGYHIQRILSSFIVWAFANVFKIELTDNFIVNSFVVLNIISVVISIFFWEKINRMYSFSNKIRFIGIVLLFINLPILKQSFYYPLLNDTLAFMIGTLLLYFYLKNNNMGLLISTIIGSFVFPTFLYFGLVLYLFPKEEYLNENKIPVRRIVIFIISFCVAFIYLAWELYTFVYKSDNISKFNLNSVQSIIDKDWFYVSLIICLVYLFIVVFNLLKNDEYLSPVLRVFFSKRFFIGILGFIIIKIATKYISSPVSGYGISDYFFVAIRHSITNPFKFIISHIVYFGPVVIFGLIYYNKLKENIFDLGRGYVFLILIFLILAINPESRVLINLFPFLVFWVIYSLRNVNFSTDFIAIVLISSLFLSRIWYPINIALPFNGKYIEFPWQHYFMFHGPWMSKEMYIVQFIIIIIISLSLYSILWKRKVL